MGFAWLALPLAAYLGMKNPVVGLSGYGFILVNSLVHLGAAVNGQLTGTPLLESAGFFTGVFAFLALVALIIHACAQGSFMPRRGLGIALTSPSARCSSHCSSAGCSSSSRELP